MKKSMSVFCAVMLLTVCALPVWAAPVELFASDAYTSTHGGRLSLTDLEKSDLAGMWQGRIYLIPKLDLSITLPEQWVEIPRSMREEYDGPDSYDIRVDAFDGGVKIPSLLSFQAYFDNTLYGGTDLKTYTSEKAAYMMLSKRYQTVGKPQQATFGGKEAWIIPTRIAGKGSQALNQLHISFWAGKTVFCVRFDYTDDQKGALDAEIASMVRAASQIPKAEMEANAPQTVAAGGWDGNAYVFGDYGIKLVLPEGMRGLEPKELAALGSDSAQLYSAIMMESDPASPRNRLLLAYIKNTSYTSAAQNLRDVAPDFAAMGQTVSEVAEIQISGFPFAEMMIVGPEAPGSCNLMLCCSLDGGKMLIITYQFSSAYAKEAIGGLDKLIVPA